MSSSWIIIRGNLCEKGGQRVSIHTILVYFVSFLIEKHKINTFCLHFSENTIQVIQRICANLPVGFTSVSPFDWKMLYILVA